MNQIFLTKKNGQQKKAPKRLVEDLIYYPYRFVKKMGVEMSDEGNEYFVYRLKK